MRMPSAVRMRVPAAVRMTVRVRHIWRASRGEEERQLRQLRERWSEGAVVKEALWDV